MHRCWHCEAKGNSPPAGSSRTRGSQGRVRTVSAWGFLQKAKDSFSEELVGVAVSLITRVTGFRLRPP
jgi:hypothetical protein